MLVGSGLLGDGLWRGMEVGLDFGGAEGLDVGLPELFEGFGQGESAGAAGGGFGHVLSARLLVEELLDGGGPGLRVFRGED